MKIYGVAVLAACYLSGQLLGEVLGYFFAFDGNIGGVGFGMLFLIFLPFALGLWLVICGFLIWGYLKRKLADKT